MTNILLSGALGHMGQVIYNATLGMDDMRIIEGIDRSEATAPFPVYKSYAQVKVKPDLVMDFSHPNALDPLLAYCRENCLPAVICTTGHNEAGQRKIAAAAKGIPIFYTFNTSLGIALMRSLIQQAARVLGDGYDIEILEKHHRRKIDAPSGTAIMLYESINKALDKPRHAVYDRHQRREPRGKGEIGISAIRGGTITGEHSVMFCGEDEVFEITHSASSRNVFATGALKAARLLPGRQPGLYSMDDIIAWANEAQ